MNILIIGKNSYIGNHIDKWLTANGHYVKQLDVLTDEWKNYNYSNFDGIIHVAGIVHQPKCNDWSLYKKVNTDMPIQIASMAKNQGVRLYVYFSTMGVYASGKKLSGSIINEKTPLQSDDMYGRSKLMAEEGLSKLHNNSFNIAFVRPPSVYGEGCKGGYITGFTKIVRNLPIIPRAYLNARQSFIYIDNLCECIRLIIENNLSGIFCPQDDKTPNANELFEAIANGIGKKYHDSKFMGFLLQLISFIPLVKKAYGGIEYSRSLSDIKGYNYIVVPFQEGIKQTVKNL